MLTGSELASLATDLDRLIERFPQEWREFLKTLSRANRKEVKKYLWYRKNPGSEWSFAEHTALVVESANSKAKTLYWTKIRYKQLEIPGIW